VKGILADVHMTSDVEGLVAAMQREPWTEFWEYLGLVLYRFEDVGLTPTSTDLEIWQRCQAEELILITNNRNEDSADSMETAIHTLNTPISLPVFTIGNLPRFQKSRAYAERVLKTLMDYLLDIDRVRGAGRLYLP
jgi:predicted nuclease of predicted toxin-antitoxin system